MYSVAPKGTQFLFCRAIDRQQNKNLINFRSFSYRLATACYKLQRQENVLRSVRFLLSHRIVVHNNVVRYDTPTPWNSNLYISVSVNHLHRRLSFSCEIIINKRKYLSSRRIKTGQLRFALSVDRKLSLGIKWSFRGRSLSNLNLWRNYKSS